MPLSTGSGGQRVPLDEITGVQTTIPVVHHEVHEGEMYIASYKSAEGGDIADDASLEVLIQTGAKLAHSVFSGASGGTAELFFFEGTTVSGIGTALTEFNLKRYSTNVATVVATHTPTVTGAGTQLLNPLIPGGSGPGMSTTGAAIRSNTEWILAANTAYLVRLTNRAGSAQPMGIIIQWYEESTA